MIMNNAFWNFKRQRGVTTWKPSVVGYGHFLELPNIKLPLNITCEELLLVFFSIIMKNWLLLKYIPVPI